MPELVLLVGLQASGKSSYVRAFLAATHVVVSKDLMPNVRRRDLRQQRQVREALAAGHSVVVDNTNPTPELRAPLLQIAREFGVPVRAIWFESIYDDCVARNQNRSAPVPLVGLRTVARDLRPPTREEGFAIITGVRLLESGFEEALL